MQMLIRPGDRWGSVSIPASKSCAHRQLICAALSKEKTSLICDGISKDIAATMDCLAALGVHFTVEENGKITVDPTERENHCSENAPRLLRCGESGSTLRFLLPVVGALGADTVFYMEGRLPNRPMDALREELIAHGMTIRQEGAQLFASGQLQPGEYTMPGNISSQYISGLLFALPLLAGDSRLTVTGRTESADYIALTEAALEKSGVCFRKEGQMYEIPGTQCYLPPESGKVEQDWSNAAFFLCMGALSPKGVTVRELPLRSKQGDREILPLLRRFGAEIQSDGNRVTVRRGTLQGQTVDASAIPDLVPTVSALAALAQGPTKIVGAARLRLKESDRLETTCAMLQALGADISQTEDGLVICGKPTLQGGIVDAAGDHRIAMAAAVAACGCTAPVTVLGSECVEKSYPAFWTDLENLEEEN